MPVFLFIPPSHPRNDLKMYKARVGCGKEINSLYYFKISFHFPDTNSFKEWSNSVCSLIGYVNLWQIELSTSTFLFCVQNLFIFKRNMKFYEYRDDSIITCAIIKLFSTSNTSIVLFVNRMMYRN